ncbi:MAG: PAS domain-containing protein [Opitutae bacterium]|nr:PAS domain-containing protein [Opitutae bacterium]
MQTLSPPAASAPPAAAAAAPAVWSGAIPAAFAQGGSFIKAFEESPALTALFKKPGFELIYINAVGRRWLDPESVGTFGSLTMQEIFGVNSLSLLKNQILLKTSVFGKWSGACTLRDAWGSELAVQATITEHAGEKQAAARFLCLQATQKAGGHDTDEAESGLSDHELLHALLESLPDSIFFKDLHSRFIRVNKAMAQKIGGVEPAALIGHTDFDYFTAEHAQPTYESEQEIIRTGQPVIELEEKETWPDGHVTWVATTKLPLRDRTGCVIGTYGISRDITARKEAEEQKQSLQLQLQLAQKLESIGRLAAGIAHEINTPSQFITDNTHFLVNAFKQLREVLEAHQALRARAGAEGVCAEEAARALAVEKAAEVDYLAAEIPRTLEQTLEGLGRVARIVRSLKEFSHPNNTQSTAADLNRAIENAVTVTRHEWKYVAEVILELDPELPPVPCVVDEFNQVMLNLLVNAAHAIGSAQKAAGSSELGRITIRTRFDDQRALIDVQDTGIGIPPGIRHRVFEPFFTTKEMGKGTGQGLTLVHAVIVQHHQGEVDFTTEVGRGTTFHLKLPRHKPQPRTSPT